MIGFGKEQAEVTGVDFGVAFDKLASLETSREIADMLISSGVKGYKADAESCVITAWMHEQTGLDIVTNYSAVRAVDDTHKTVPGKYENITLAMRSFIMNFDQGDYSELVIERKEY